MHLKLYRSFYAFLGHLNTLVFNSICNKIVSGFYFYREINYTGHVSFLTSLQIFAGWNSWKKEFCVGGREIYSIQSTSGYLLKFYLEREKLGRNFPFYFKSTFGKILGRQKRCLLTSFLISMRDFYLFTFAMTRIMRVLCVHYNFHYYLQSLLSYCQWPSILTPKAINWHKNDKNFFTNQLNLRYEILLAPICFDLLL